MNNLDAQVIARGYQTLIGTEKVEIAIEVVQETGSTNLDLLQRAKSLTGPVLLVAENQTAGRGRAGRTWLSNPGGVLTFSLAWHFAKDPQALMGLPLVVGVAVAEQLRSLGVQVLLKWPNDILKDGKKLGGILVETQSADNGIWAVIGIGLNLRIPDELEAQIGQAVADAPWLAQMERNKLLACLLQALQTGLERFSLYGFEVYADRWNRLHAHAQLPVAIIDQGVMLHQGIALGVDARGCLQIHDGESVQTVHSGDVSLRALP